MAYITISYQTTIDAIETRDACFDTYFATLSVERAHSGLDLVELVRDIEYPVSQMSEDELYHFIEHMHETMSPDFDYRVDYDEDDDMESVHTLH